MGQMGAWDAVGLVVSLACLCTVATGFVWFMHHMSPARVLDRLAQGCGAAWLEHLRWTRKDFVSSLRMREEAYSELDGAKLDLADEFLRDDLHRLGGLAGAW
uniref:Uncharacterized protein n=1 Tax=Ralstonia pickettii (strain 12J) TaxID=402626 RepID=B2UIN8_RALPJ